MAKYRVDKKAFEQKQLDEQLRQIQLQEKFLKDEPLKRSEVDKYTKLKVNSGIKNVLVSFGTIFATLIALIIFILLGALLFTRGRTGVLEGHNLDSGAIYQEFLKSIDPPTDADRGSRRVVDYALDSEVHGVEMNDTVIVIYNLYAEEFRNTNAELKLRWKVDRINGSYGTLLVGDQKDWSVRYVLDNDTAKITFTQLLDNFYETMPDGTWAKSLVSSRLLGSSAFLVVVLGIVYFATIIGYLIVLVVGIRYIIRTVIAALRKAGYLVSDFADEVIGAVRDELPVVDEDRAEELDLVAIRKQVQKKLAQDDSLGGLPEYKFEPEDNLEEDVPKQKESSTASLKEVKKEVKEEVKEEVKPVVIASPEPVVEEPKEEKKKESKAQDEIADIFNL